MQSLYSAFYKQPLQIHKKWGWGDMFAPGSLADKTSSTIYHMLNFVYKLLRNNSQQAFTVICMRDYKRCDKNICGLSSKELRNRSDPSDLKVAVWQPDVWIVGRIAKKSLSLWPIHRTSGQRIWKGQRAELHSSFSWNLLWMVHFFTTLTQFCL